MSRVYVPLKGGVGNLLFEYCAALGLQATRGHRVVLVPESEALVHRLATYVGPLEVPVAGRSDRRRLGDLIAAPSSKFGRALNVFGRHAVEFAISQRLGPTAAMPARLPRRSVAFDTYFQHPTWYEHSLGAVLGRLEAERPGDLPGLVEGVVAVHLRRTDYVPLGWALPFAYYERCLALARQRGFRKVLVASDDAVVKQLLDSRLAAEGWTVVDTSAFGAPSALTDFHLVAACEAIVMSNSTFSWWSTRLRGFTASGPPAPVFCPDTWVEDGQHLMQDSWTQVSAG